MVARGSIELPGSGVRFGLAPWVTKLRQNGQPAPGDPGELAEAVGPKEAGEKSGLSTRRCIEWLREKARGTRIPHDQVGESKAPVQPQRSPIVVLDLESELAASTSARAIFRCGKQTPTYPSTTPLREHCQVVDVQERSSPECRETLKAHRDSYRAFLLDGKQHQCGGMIPKGRNQALAHLCRERLSSAHRVGGIRIEHLDDSSAVRRVFEVCVYDFHAHPIRLASSRRPRQNVDSSPGTTEPAFGCQVNGPVRAEASAGYDAFPER